ncbi:MAG: hypothetical protein BAJALOKI1v1_1700009 [Promethearchaeota archaeon]|nr:MAG: hypothetical protein BAJALOKI1v1_1700009 [Candidatus Lokiarchaeota archaeon]
MEKKGNNEDIEKRRTLGVHLTSEQTFLSYIFPHIKDFLSQYIWIDLFCGEGNLIFPILDHIPKSKRVAFFQHHIYLSDIQPQMIQKCINKALSYKIPLNLAKNNIFQRDNLGSIPNRLKNIQLPLYHITNPPYLYLGYIRKHEETKQHLKYFLKENEGYQDLYQIAMMNDLRNSIMNLVYIIPSNFIFGASVSNKFRIDFLKYYDIKKLLIFETKLFDFTGTNICIVFFKRKESESAEVQIFSGLKFKKNNTVLERNYTLRPDFKYRGGAEFDDFTKKNKSLSPLKVKYYLLNKEVEANQGREKITVIDANEYVSSTYKRKTLQVLNSLKNKITSNILYVRTVDTGTMEGRVGLYLIRNDFNVDGIYVSKAPYRTSPIQIFLTPMISPADQLLLKDYFNMILEYFRTKLDSEFLTTYKYSNAEYTRKYLGLTQVRKLIQTFPINKIDDNNKEKLTDLIGSKSVEEILKFIIELKKNTKKEDPTSREE